MHLSIFLVINQLNTQILLCMSSHHADYSSSHFLCPAIMLITPAPTPYVQSSCWLFQHPISISSHHADYSSTHLLCPIIMLITPAPSMSSHHAVYSSTICVCSVIMLIPAPTSYVQSSCRLLHHTLSMSSHPVDYSITHCLFPVIMLISPAHSVYVQSSFWIHPWCPDAFSISLCSTSCIFCVSASLNNPLPEMFTYYENFARCERVVWHSARWVKGGRGCKRLLWGSEPIRVLFY